MTEQPKSDIEILITRCNEFLANYKKKFIIVTIFYAVALVGNFFFIKQEKLGTILHLIYIFYVLYIAIVGMFITFKLKKFQKEKLDKEDLSN